MRLCPQAPRIVVKRLDEARKSRYVDHRSDPKPRAARLKRHEYRQISSATCSSELMIAFRLSASVYHEVSVARLPTSLYINIYANCISTIANEGIQAPAREGSSVVKNEISMTASFALNFILQLCFTLVCLSLLYPFSPTASLNFTPPRTAYSARSLLGTPPAADAALMKYMASARLALFVERGFGAGRMAVFSAPMCVAR